MARVNRIGLLVLLAGLTLAGPAVAKNKRINIPMEEFLPPNTLAYVSLPNANFLEDLLTRAGEDRAAVAKRLVAGSEVGAESVATLLEIVQAASDGPVTWSLHRVGLPPRPGVVAADNLHFLVSLDTVRKGNLLEVVGQDLVRGLLAPVYAKVAKDEELMGFKALHLSGKGPDLYVVSARGQLFLSSSPLILGRILKEMQSPSGNTLAYDDEFIAARGAAAATAGRRPHGFLWVKDPSLFPAAELLDCRIASGVLVQEEDGYRDEVTVVTDAKSLLRRLSPEGKAPGGWAHQTADGIWIGAALTPQAVQKIAAGSVQPWQEYAAAGIEKIAAGPVEILLRPGQANLLRIALRPEADTIEVAKVYRDTARVEGRVMIFCEDPKARAAAVAGEEAVIDAPMALKAPVARLLDLLGMKGETAGPRTALTATVVSRDLAEGSVMFKSGRAEMGLFALIVLSLTK